MRISLLVLLVAVLAMPLVTPLIVSEANALPKCRNVAGYEPKPTCEARNQRAQWQAEQTARMTAQLVADAMARVCWRHLGGYICKGWHGKFLPV